MKSLFDHTNLLSMQLKNRFFRGGVWEDLADKKGHMTPQLFKIYEELAKGGVGTIITGYALVSRDEQPSHGMMGIYEDAFIEEYRELTEMVHKYGVNIIMQIGYGGSRTMQQSKKRVIMGPSSIENQVTHVTPIEMSKRDIRHLTYKYGEAALRAKKAGFDGVEIHAANGYLLSQFLCPYYNRREDEYGGSIEGRGRIVFEVYQKVREEVGEGFPVLVKINCEDFMPKGLTKGESLYVVTRLVELGVNGIEVSGGNECSTYVLENDLGPARKIASTNKEQECYFKDYATKLAERVDVPIILSGGNRHLEVMEDLLNHTKIQYFSMTRPLTAEPDLIKRWKNSDRKEIKCISCNACYKTLEKRCIQNNR